MFAWQIYTYGGGEVLQQVFNGVVAILGADTYTTFISLMGLMTLVGAVFTVTYKGKTSTFLYSMMYVFLMLNLLLLPKAPVLITDRVIESKQYAVDHVPIGLALFASLSSQVGDSITQLFDSVFSMPDDFKYHESGTLMSGSIVRASAQFRITDANLANDIKSFIQQCVQYDILLGKYSLEELLSTNDIWSMVSANPSPARAFIYQGQINTCQKGSQLLTEAWKDEIERGFSLYGRRIFGNYQTNDQARSSLIGYLPLSYQYLLQLSDSASQLMQQTMLINAFEDGILSSAAEVNAPAAVQNYAEARATQQQRSAYQLTGQMAAQWLPIMKNVFEAIIYASFILLFPLALLFPMGFSIIKNYLFSLAWIQLWAPLYAVLNMVMTWFSQTQTESAGLTLDGYALSVSTLPGIEQVNVDMGALAGYIAMSIPFFTYYLVKNGAAGLSQLATHLGSLNQQAVMHGAEEATSGNYSTGNVNVYNHNSYNTSAHHTNENLSYQSGMASLQTDTGAMIHHQQDGTSVIETGHAISNIPTSIISTESLRATYSTMSEKSTQSAINQGVQLATAEAGMHRQLYDLSTAYGHSEHYDSGISHSESRGFSETFNEYHSLVDTFAEKNNLSKGQGFHVLASAHATGSLGLDTPIIEAQIGGRAELQGMSDARKQEVFEAAHDYIQSTNFNSATESAIRASQELHYKSTDDTARRLSEGVNTAVETTNNIRSDMGVSLQQAESYREAASLATEKGSSITTIANQQFVNHLQKEMGSITAVEELITRDPVTAQAKAAQFIQNNYGDILKQAAQKDGLGTASSVEKNYQQQEKIVDEWGTEAIKFRNTLDAHSTQLSGSDLKESQASSIKREVEKVTIQTNQHLEEEKNRMKEDSKSQKVKVVENSDQDNNTIKNALWEGLASTADTVIPESTMSQFEKLQRSEEIKKEVDKSFDK